MEQPPTSPKFHFYDRDEAAVATPTEWTPLTIELPISVDGWEESEFKIQGVTTRHYIARHSGATRVLADWPRSGPGRYQLELRAGSEIVSEAVEVRAAKLSEGAFETMIEDLEARLPASIAIGLQQAGGLIGIELEQLRETTLNEEVLRLERATFGDAAGPGLEQLLDLISEDPHRTLAPEELWVRRGRARRPAPARLAHAMFRGGNVDDDGRPLRLVDARVSETFDVYENRLLRSFYEQLRSRALRLLQTRAATNPSALDRVSHVLEALSRARRRAAFLDEVALRAALPERLTMVLLKHPRYSAMLERYVEFRRSAIVRFDDDALDAPLNGTPYLYQAWGLLTVIDVLLEVAVAAGFEESSQTLARRRTEGDLVIELVPGGKPTLVMRHPGSGARLSVIHERHYGSSGDLRSVSFGQVPDVAIEIERPGAPSTVVIFDPKYKLHSADIVDADAEPSGGPKKEDIDKMHAYRDAIRSSTGAPVVTYAGILYPGETVHFDEGIGAIGAVPGNDAGMRDEIRRVLVSELTA